MKFLIIVIVALSIAFVVGAKMGIIEVPGLSPVVKKKGGAKIYTSDAESDVANKATPVTKPENKAGISENKTDPKTVENKAASVAQKTSETPAESDKPENSTTKPTPPATDTAAANKTEPIAQNSSAAPSQTAAPKTATPAKPTPKQAAVVDPLAGQKQLAEVWKKVEPDALVKIVADWKDEDLAKQLSVMSPKQVGEILALMTPNRASKLSKQLQLIAQADAKKAAESGGKKSS